MGFRHVPPAGRRGLSRSAARPRRRAAHRLPLAARRAYAEEGRTAGPGPRLTRELLPLRRPPTAIFAASDTHALGVLEAAGFEGFFAVPDDLEIAPYVGLTTVWQSLEESGRRGPAQALFGSRTDQYIIALYPTAAGTCPLSLSQSSGASSERRCPERSAVWTQPPSS